MTTSKRTALPLKKHGITGYKTHGCRCYPCCAANSQYQMRRDRALAMGRWQALVDSGPVREHVVQLTERGMGQRQIAIVAGVAYGVVGRLIYGRPDGKAQTKVTPRTAAAILAIPIDTPVLASSARIPSIGTARRIQALCCLGWSFAEQGRRIGWTATNLRGILRRPTVEKRTADLVAGLYRDLGGRIPPPSTGVMQARRSAHRNGWFSPAAWEDNIDDPDAIPSVLTPVRPPVPMCNELAIQHVAAGHTSPATLDYPSRMEWIVRRRAAGDTARDLAQQLDVSDFTVLKLHKDALALNQGMEWPEPDESMAMPDAA